MIFYIVLKKSSPSPTQLTPFRKNEVFFLFFGQGIYNYCFQSKMKSKPYSESESKLKDYEDKKIQPIILNVNDKNKIAVSLTLCLI